MPLEWSDDTQFAMAEHTLFYFLHKSWTINDCYIRLSSCTCFLSHSVCILLMMLQWISQCIVAPNSCWNADMWKVLSNSLDISFIHGHIYSWQCENSYSYWLKFHLDKFLMASLVSLHSHIRWWWSVEQRMVKIFANLWYYNSTVS